MKERKYKEEYKLETQLDVKTGKPKQIPVYMGDYYVLAAPKKEIVKAGLVWLAAHAVCYGAYLLMNSPSSYCIYVLPFACCALIPLLYAVMGAVNALRAPRRMTRVQKETGVARLMRSLMGCGIFTALAALGDGVFMARNGAAGEVPAALALLAASVLAWMGFARVCRLHAGIATEPGLAAQEAQRSASKEAGEQP